MKSVLKELGKELLHSNKMSSSIRNILEKRCQENDGLPCELVDIKYAPFEKIAKGYRNKCEFTIGKNFSLKSLILIEEFSISLKCLVITIFFF